MRPLIQGKMGKGVPFKAWPGGETGAEVGYYSAKTGTAVSAVLWNGMNAAGNASGKTQGANPDIMIKTSSSLLTSLSAMIRP
ncbi:hypothetical protein BMS3Bbin05_01751 [bacterium BMS3Bbin05]|nr:hypothetical protein BMS3Bbin05_01751 [bacterium BMS3Bbin05]